MTSRGKNSHPDSPEQILEDAGIKFIASIASTNADRLFDKYKAEALTKLDEYYTNKFLEIIGPHTSLSKKEIKNGRLYILGDPQADAVDRYKDELSKRVRAELRQAIKQLSKRGKDNE